ncbi:hypothetical protein F4860DRAFT_516630 [Xylaria cubensis]|nr:hypothetical protein F4860DRAFT_516630 [Xylaria cubensis]
MASFYNSFDHVTQHTDLLLEWDHANATDYPLVIHARVLNKTSDREVNTIEVDIASGLTNDSFFWEDLPFPLPFLSTATYELWILRQQRAEDVTLRPFASSPSFTILSPIKDDSNDWQTTTNETTTDNPEPTNPPHSDGRPSSSTAIAAGLVVPFVVAISVSVFLCMQRRQRRISAERRKERAGLVID